MTGVRGGSSHYPLGLAARACRLGARALRGAGLACCRRRTIRCASGSLPRSRQASTRHPSSSPSACLPRSQSAPGGLSSRPPATRCPRSSQSQTWTAPSSPAGGKLAIGAPALEIEPPTARPDGCMLTKICAPEAVWHDMTNARGLLAAARIPKSGNDAVVVYFRSSAQMLRMARSVKMRVLAQSQKPMSDASCRDTSVASRPNLLSRLEQKNAFTHPKMPPKMPVLTQSISQSVMRLVCDASVTSIHRRERSRPKMPVLNQSKKTIAMFRLDT